jgi:hypothetical protein
MQKTSNSLSFLLATPMKNKNLVIPFLNLDLDKQVIEPIAVPLTNHPQMVLYYSACLALSDRNVLFTGGVN